MIQIPGLMHCLRLGLKGQNILAQGKRSAALGKRAVEQQALLWSNLSSLFSRKGMGSRR